MLVFLSLNISSTAFYARPIHGVIPAQHGLVRTLHHWPMAFRQVTQFLVLRFPISGAKISLQSAETGMATSELFTKLVLCYLPDCTRTKPVCYQQL